jgi:hypothetical protein
MLTRILLVGVLVIIAIFAISTAIVFLAPYIAIILVLYLLVKSCGTGKKTEMRDITPRE